MSREEAVSLSVVPKLAELVEDPGRVQDVPVETIPGLRGKLAELDTMLQMRVAMAQRNGQGQTHAGGDRLLTAEEAARKLGKSRDALYRNAKQYPFTVRDGRSVRFSEAGIEKFIRQRTGR